MSNIKLFSTKKDTARELPGSAMALEKSLQILMERNLKAFLGAARPETGDPRPETSSLRRPCAAPRASRQRSPGGCRCVLQNETTWTDSLGWSMR